MTLVFSDATRTSPIQVLLFDLAGGRLR